MTISTSINREFTVGEIMLQAYQVAGLKTITQSLTTAEKTLGKRLLETILDELPAYGVQARSRGFDSITCTSGTFTYNLGVNVAEVIGDAAYINASEADVTKANSEVLVIQKPQEDWQRISAKSATGTPSIFWVDRSATRLAVRLWPIPTEAGTVRFVVRNHLADVDDENATVDLETFWMQYIIWELAAQLAESQSMPGTKCERLAAQAARRLGRARSFANDHSSGYIYMDHG